MTTVSDILQQGGLAILTQKYNTKVATTFSNYCKEEDYTEIETIECDFEGGYADSCIISEICEILDWTSESTKKQLFTDISNIFFTTTTNPTNTNNTNTPNTQQKPIFKYAQSVSNIINQKNIKPSFSTKISRASSSKMITRKDSFQRYINPLKVDFNITHSDINKCKAEYASQCPSLLPPEFRNSGLKDASLLKVLTVGYKNNTPLLQNIVDTYCRCRINEWVINKKCKMDESRFALEYHFFNQLKKINRGSQAVQLQSAIQSFHRRICPKIQFQALEKIDDSLSDYFLYSSSVIKYVQTMANVYLPPFQIDLWIIPQSMASATMNDPFESDSDSDDYDPENSQSSDDCIGNQSLMHKKTIGDIKERLVHEKCLFVENEILSTAKMPSGTFPRELNSAFKSFFEQLNKKYNDDDYKCNNNSFENDPHLRRICIIIDRRNSKQNDMLYVFEPPANVNTVHSKHLPESYFNASRECILPGIGYNEGKQDYSSVLDHKGLPNCKTLHVGSGLGGYQFTLSFHIESVDEIKCYLFFQGWISRFLPQDMIDVWPLWFVENKVNCGFVEEMKWVDEMRMLEIPDDNFFRWFEDSTGRTDLIHHF